MIVKEVKRLEKRGMTSRECMRLLMRESPARAYEAISELLMEKRSIAAAAEFAEVDVKTFARWCEKVATANRRQDPRELLAGRTAKTEFGELVIYEPQKAREILSNLLATHATVSEVAVALGVKTATIRRWRKALGLRK